MKKLVNDVGNLLRESGFEAYWPNDPVPLSDLNTPIKKPKQVEIDIIAKISSVGFLVEVTMRPRAYLNLLKILERHPYYPEIAGAPDLLLQLLP